MESEICALTKEVKKILELQNVVVPEHCEQFICRCIRVKNYDVEKAASLVRNFGKMMGMKEMQDLYAEFKPTFLRGLYESEVIFPLSKRDPKGRLIIVARANCWDPLKYDFDQALAGAIALFNYVVGKFVDVQREGLIFFLDFGGWNLQQLRAVKIQRLKIAVQLLQNSCPGKIKAIHILHFPKVIQFIFTLVKPFLKAKLASRIHFHQDDLSLDLSFEPKILPKALGGMADEGYVDGILLESLFEQDQYYKGQIWSNLNIQTINVAFHHLRQKSSHEVVPLVPPLNGNFMTMNGIIQS